jgi:hypothetical protein
MIWIKELAVRWGLSPSLVITQAMHGPNSWLLRHPRSDRPEPAAICRRRLRPHDAADVPLTVENVVVVIGPRTAGAGFGGAFEGERGWNTTQKAP